MKPTPKYGDRSQPRPSAGYPPPRQRRTIPDFLVGLIRPAEDAPLPAIVPSAPKCPACGARLIVWRARRASCPACAFVCVVDKP